MRTSSGDQAIHSGVEIFRGYMVRWYSQSR
jgi:hypothetical protein